MPPERTSSGTVSKPVSVPSNTGQWAENLFSRVSTRESSTDLTVHSRYDADEEALEAMRDAGVIWVPTIAAYSEGVVTAQRNLFEQEQSAALSGQSLSNDAHRLAKAEVFAAEDRWARMQRAFKIGVKVGVMIGE